MLSSITTARLRWALVVAPPALMFAVACSPSGDHRASGGVGVGVAGGGSGGAGGSVGEGGGGGGGGGEGGGGGGGGPTVCSGACAAAALDAAFEGAHRPLDRAQLGTDDVAGEPPMLYVEAHLSGDPACPTETSPSPDRTVILSGVPRGAAGKTLTEADGLRLSYLEFAADSTLPPIVKATSVTLTGIMEDPATPPAWFAADLVATFDEGTVTGHLYATYCQSLSW